MNLFSLLQTEISIFILLCMCIYNIGILVLVFYFLYESTKFLHAMSYVHKVWLWLEIQPFGLYTNPALELNQITAVPYICNLQDSEAFSAKDV